MKEARRALAARIVAASGDGGLRAGAAGADHHGRDHDAPPQPVHRVPVRPRPVDGLLGGHPPAGQPEHRDAHHAERHLGGQLRGHGPGQRHRHGSLRLDRAPARARCAARTGSRTSPSPSRSTRFTASLGPGALKAFVVGSVATPLERLHARLLSALPGLGQPARVRAPDPQLHVAARPLPERHRRLHLARQRDPRPLHLLHGRTALLQRPGRDAGRLRLRVQRRLQQGARPDPHLVLEAGHAGRRRHPPAGHALRLQPHERLAGSTPRSSTTCPQPNDLGLRFAATRTLSGRNVGPVHDAFRPASSTSSTSRGP